MKITKLFAIFLTIIYFLLLLMILRNYRYDAFELGTLHEYYSSALFYSRYFYFQIVNLRLIYNSYSEIFFYFYILIFSAHSRTAS